MTETPLLPMLPNEWESTTATLHAYALAIGAIPRAYARAHPKWWHISLELGPEGLASDPVPLPGGGSLVLTMDLRRHEVLVTTNSGDRHTLSMQGGLTGTEMGERLIGIASAYGLEGDLHRERFENDDPRAYDARSAAVFFEVLSGIARVFAEHRNRLEGDVSPVQVWPHGFDLAFEWFGTKVESYEENGRIVEQPSQLNLGFYPAGRPYFYSNPWPFDERLTGAPLPHGAQWHTDGWKGTILYYDQLVNDPDAEKKLLEYARAVFEIAAPSLTA